MVSSHLRLWLACVALSAFAHAAYAAEPADHCAQVRDDDTVETIPPSLVAQAARLFHEPRNHVSAHRDAYVYRCMGGSVWICAHGANLSCAEGDTSPAPGGVETYCKQNPDASIVPMYVTGHDTVHSFQCVGGEARVTRSQKTDARGFIVRQWRRVR
jgi:hypothetical protein